MRGLEVTGQTFGRLTAIKRLYKTKDHQWVWLFKCICGKEKAVRVRAVANGNTSSCGCLKKETAAKEGHSHIKDISGLRVGKLIVIKPSGGVRSGNLLWTCRCDCGKEKIIVSSYLIRKRVKSCGCSKQDTKEITVRRPCLKYTTHGMTNTKFWRTWKNMRKRCYDPNAAFFKDYGGRGIKVCDRWLNFLHFRDDLLQAYQEHSILYGEKNTTLDRINPNGNYDLDNVRWATWEIQAHKFDDSLYRSFAMAWDAR